MKTEKILIIGANGQFGTVLSGMLQKLHGIENVLCTDVFQNSTFEGWFEILDATDISRLSEIVQEKGISQIYHLAAVLSAKAEKNPRESWDINMNTWLNVLEVSRIHKVKKIFYPSSIAVFGKNINRAFCSQDSPLLPTTVYGNSKVSGEIWANYYFEKYGLDIRSLRFPGIIGHQSMPGGGTTDYAIEIFHKAIHGETYINFLSEDTQLPMIYMEDAISATIALMEAPKENIKVRFSYNLAGLSFSPYQLEKAILKEFPNLNVVYKPDYRQDIANSWPMVIDDTAAREDWGWKPHYGLDEIVQDMLFHLTGSEKEVA